MSDLLLVAWLRGRQVESNALFWLSLVGYERGKRGLSGRLYEVYLASFFLWWVVAVAAIAFHQAAQVGRLLDPRWREFILGALPWLVLAIQVAMAAGSLRESPFKLTFPDAAYLAGSPVSRSAAVFVAWLQALAKALLVASPTAALVAVVLTEGQGSIDRAALQAAVAALPLATLLLGLAWSLGLARLAWPTVRRWRLVWLSPLLLFGLAWLRPELGLWPGRVLATAIVGQASAGQVLPLALLALAGAGGVAWLGGEANMADALAESTTYARLRALGFMAWLSPDVSNSIRAQAALARRRPFLHLPRTQGLRNLLARAALTYLRRPGLLLGTLVWSGVLLQASFWLLPGGAFAPPWIYWLLALLLVPRQGLLEVFQADATNPFLRQLLPVGDLSLLVADTAPPLLLLVAAASLARLLWPAPLAETALAIAALLVLGALLALCQALTLIRSPLLPRIPYPLAAVVTFGTVIAAQALSGSPLIALGVGAVLVVVLGFLVAGGRRRRTRVVGARG